MRGAGLSNIADPQFAAFIAALMNNLCKLPCRTGFPAGQFPDGLGRPSYEIVQVIYGAASVANHRGGSRPRIAASFTLAGCPG